MAGASEPEPRTLTWLSGFLLGMAVAQAQGFYETTRSELEPRVGRWAATGLGAAAWLAWLVFVMLLVGWFTRRSWVRAWFAAAEQKPDKQAEPPAGDVALAVKPRQPDDGQ